MTDNASPLVRLGAKKKALTKVVITGAPSGHQIFFFPLGLTQSLSLHLVLAIGSHHRY